MTNKNRTIAVILDQFIEESGLVGLIKKAGFPVEAYKRDDQTVGKLAKLKPAVIITDQNENSKNRPFAIVEDIRKQEKIKDTEIFYFGNELDVKTEVGLRSLNVDSYFLKTAPLEAVPTALETYFNPANEESYDDWEKRLYQETSGVYGHGTAPPPVVASAPAFSPTDDSFNAFEAFTSVLGLEDSDLASKSHFDLGSMLFKSKQHDQAITELKMAVGSAKYMAESNLMLGEAYRSMGKLNDSLRSLQKGQKVAPASMKIEFNYQMGLTFETAGKTTEAYKYLMAVYKVSQDYKDTKTRLLKIKKSTQAIA